MSLQPVDAVITCTHCILKYIKQIRFVQYQDANTPIQIAKTVKYDAKALTVLKYKLIKDVKCIQLV